MWASPRFSGGIFAEILVCQHAAYGPDSSVLRGEFRVPMGVGSPLSPPFRTNGRPVFTQALYPVNFLVRYGAIG